MIVGEHTRDNDLDVNPVRAKKLTNVRSTPTDEAVGRLMTPRSMNLEEAISFVRSACLLVKTETE
jgi:GTP-binding protein